MIQPLAFPVVVALEADYAKDCRRIALSLSIAVARYGVIDQASELTSPDYWTIANTQHAKFMRNG
jgi:hypothetical protein